MSELALLGGKDYVKVFPKPGQMLIFPAAVWHSVTPHLGDYRRLAEASRAVLMLASDHGFFWKEGRPTTLSSNATATAAKWHRDDGMFVLWGPGIPWTCASSARRDS